MIEHLKRRPEHFKAPPDRVSQQAHHLRGPADAQTVRAHGSRRQCMMLRGIDPLNIQGREQNNWGKNK